MKIQPKYYCNGDEWLKMIKLYLQDWKYYWAIKDLSFDYFAEMYDWKKEHPIDVAKNIISLNED